MSQITTIKTASSTLDCAIIEGGSRPFALLPGLYTKSLMPLVPAVAKQYQRFLDKYTIYLFDRVTEPPEGYAFQDMVADTIHAMDALHLGDACTMGVSAGGMVAQAIMAERPELVRCAVIGSSTSRMTDHARGILNGWSALARAGKTAELNRSFATMVYTEAFYARYEEAILAALDGATEADLRRFAIFADALANFKLPDGERGTARPVLAIGAEEDRIFGPEATMEIAKRNDGRFFIYKGYGHAVYDEAPDYLQKVWEFFEEN